MQAARRRLERKWAGGRGIALLVALAAGLACGATAAVPAPAAAAPGPPTNDEYALLVFTNQIRSDPAARGFADPVVAPLLWSSGLGAAARAHSDDMAANGCYQHNSCNGQSWSSRISGYYPGWLWIGENIAQQLSGPQQVVTAWLGSAGHRANLLSGHFTEFGGGVAVGQDGFGSVPYTTADLGNRGLVALNAYPALPAGAVLPRVGGGEARQLLVNYYHYRGAAPRAVSAIVGSSCVTLSLLSGSATHGTYGATRAIQGSGCIPVVFQAIRSDGAGARFPESETILVGVGTGGASCAERTAQPPSVDCLGLGPLPTPAPLPGGMRLDAARAVLRVGTGGVGRDHVRVSGLLWRSGSFDPTTADVTLSLRFSNGESWSRTLPRLCDGAPCLHANDTGSVYRASYAPGGTSLAFLRAADGGWRLRFRSTSETLGELVAGPVEVSVTADGSTASQPLDGRLRQARLVAR